MIYKFSDFMQHVRAAPMVSPMQAGQPRAHRAGLPTGAAIPSQPRDQFRALVAKHEGQLRPAVRDMLAAARGPDDEGGGTRHHTLLTLVGALIHYGWSDLAIHAGLTLPANELWGGPDRRETVQGMVNHARRREAARTAASPVRHVRWGRG
jgi:hypothetical protein